MAAVATRVSVLGPVRATVDGDAVKLRGRTARTVLARLALAGGRAVSVDELTDALWGDDPPAGATSNLQSIVSRLRAVLGRASIPSAGAGYRLDTTLVEVDLADAEAAVAAVGGVDGSELVAMIDAVLADWDGEALADVAWTPPFEPERARLAELRSRLVEERYRALIAAGRAADALADLERDATADPLRESLQLLHMAALHQCGRTAEALRVASRHRRALLETSGIDASQAVADFERSLLVADEPATVDPPRSESPDPRPRIDWLPPATPFVGRDDDLERIGELLLRERFVTVLGTGGVGKTRLAMELVAGQNVDVDDVVVVSLGALDVGAPVVGAVAAAMGLESIGDDVTETIRNRLGGRRALLVLDNCEHVVGPVRSLLTALLAVLPDLRVLATSRRPLGLAEEQVYPLAPLPVPREPDDRSPAVALYLDRVRRASPNLEIGPDRAALVADICRILDGLPLALELAAVRAGTLGLEELRSQLAAGLQPLRATASEGHSSTLDSMVEWSISLLTDPARHLFDELCVFAGNFDLGAIEAVTSLGEPVAALAELVESSLVVADVQTSPVTYRLLQPVRDAGRQNARRERRTRTVQAYAAWIGSIGDEIESRWMRDDRQGAHDLLKRRRDDLRWALSTDSTGTTTVEIDRLAAQLVWLLQQHPDVDLIEQVRRSVGETPDGWLVRAALGWWIGNPAESLEYGDRVLAAVGEGDARVPLAEWSKIPALSDMGELEPAARAASRVLEHPSTPPAVGAMAVAGWALAELQMGEIAAAREILDTCPDELRRSSGAWFIDYAHAEVLALRDPEAALELLDRGLQEAAATRAALQTRLLDLARLPLLVRLGRSRDAARLALDLVPELLDVGIVPQAWAALHRVAELLAASDFEAEASAIRAATSSPERRGPLEEHSTSLPAVVLPSAPPDRGTIDELWRPARARLLEIASSPPS